MSTRGIPNATVSRVLDVFCNLWLALETSTDRAVAIPPAPSFESDLRQALTRPTEADVLAMLLPMVPAPPFAALEDLGKCLAIMRAIDEALYVIHPRSVVLSASLAGAVVAPAWLDALAEERLTCGTYHQTPTHTVIPRGPLRRSNRTPLTTHAETLADRFAALAVVHLIIENRGAEVRITHKVVGFSSVHGVLSGRAPGEERVGFVPVAESAADIKITPDHHPGQSFLDYRLSAGVNGAGRLIKALKNMGATDVVLASELIMRHEHVEEIPERLAKELHDLSRLIVAGSGHTKDLRNGQSWNETCVMNAQGVTLWRQRKLWPAGVDSEKAKEFGVADFGPTPLILENNAAGDAVEIVDIDSFGRCIVMICQDFANLPLAAELMRSLQPDWVFVPILDTGIDEGRWPHQKAFALSDESASRFLICSSTSLGDLIGKSPVHCGLALGPLSAVDGTEGRQFRLCQVNTGSSPGYAVFEWNDGKGGKSKLGG